jgi:hypothetical protein
VYDDKLLAAETGGRPFRWARNGNTYELSFKEQRGSADWFVYRTMWQNGVLAGTGASFIIHGGCEVEGVSEEPTNVPYTDEAYARFQNAESILFYMNGLALVSRAKVFLDLPTEFPNALAQPGAKFGDAWRRSFAADAANASLAGYANISSCKEAYWWTVIGDCTLRLRQIQAPALSLPWLAILLLED